MKEMQELKRSRKGQDPDQDEDSSFLSPKIQVVVIPPTFRVPKEKYTGMMDPTDHVTCFKNMLDLYDATDAIKCRMFPATLIGMAHS